MKILLKSNDSKNWIEVENAEYVGETDLQKLIFDSPGIIPVNEIKPDTKPFCYAVWEYGLPGSGNTDILLFNPDGEIGIIECKLAANAEIKRKVIGQILEYGAYLWNTSYEELDEAIRRKIGRTLADGVASGMEGTDWEEESFRTGVAQTLEKGSFSLIIAVDSINEELRRIIKYLNECGNTAFSFHALELRRYKSDGMEILVPHIHGEMPEVKVVEKKRNMPWDRHRFFEVAAQSLSEEVVLIMRDLYEWSCTKADDVPWGRGTEAGSYTFHLLRNGKKISIFSVYTTGLLMINFNYLMTFYEEKERKAFYNKLVAIRSFAALPERINGFSSLSLVDCTKDDLELFKKAILKTFLQES